MRRPKTAVIGSSNTDLVAKTPRLPVPGETIIGSEFVIALTRLVPIVVCRPAGMPNVYEVFPNWKRFGNRSWVSQSSIA